MIQSGYSNNGCLHTRKAEILVAALSMKLSASQSLSNAEGLEDSWGVTSPWSKFIGQRNWVLQFCGQQIMAAVAAEVATKSIHSQVRSQNKQGKAIAFLTGLLTSDCHREVPSTPGEGFPAQLILPRNTLTDLPQSMPLNWFQIHSGCQLRLNITPYFFRLR